MKGSNGNGLRLCPTRPATMPRTLISHHVTLELCFARQREMFHKCPMCLHSMARSGQGNGAATSPEPTRALPAP